MKRREFLGAAALTGAAAVTRARAAEAPIEEATLEDLQRRLADGSLTSVALTQTYLERIGRLDGRGPTLRSVIETNPDAVEIAKVLDARRPGRVRSAGAAAPAAPDRRRSGTSTRAGPSPGS